MINKLLIEHHLEFLSLKGGCRGSSESTHAGLPRSGKMFWKMKNFPGQGKVRELHFQSGKFKKK